MHWMRSTGSRGWKPEEPGDFAPRTPPSPSAPRGNIPATEAFTPGDPRRSIDMGSWSI